jgi:L-histidine N-alpha-methyltransferase
MSLENQVVKLCDLDLEITVMARETIRTEISRKFELTALTKQLHDCGLPVQRIWQDERGWFALVLCQKK